MGEAKRRAAWKAKTGQDWEPKHRPAAPRTSRWSMRIRGISPEAVKKLEMERDRRREDQKNRLVGLMGFDGVGVGLSKAQINRLTAVRAQMKKRGASAAARRAFR